MTTEQTLLWQKDVTQSSDDDVVFAYELYSAIMSSDAATQEKMLNIFMEAQKLSDSDYGVNSVSDIASQRNILDMEVAKRNLGSRVNTRASIEAGQNAMNDLLLEHTPGSTSANSFLIQHIALTSVGAGVFGFVFGPMVAKKWFPQHKGWVIFTMSAIGGAIGILTSMQIARRRMIKMALGSNFSGSGKSLNGQFVVVGDTPALQPWPPQNPSSMQINPHKSFYSGEKITGTRINMFGKDLIHTGSWYIDAKSTNPSSSMPSGKY